MASGPVESVTIDGRRFTVDGEADIAQAMAGFTNEVKPNGDGSQRLVKTRKVGRGNGFPLVMDDARDDETFIQERMDSKEFFTIDFTKVDGAVWSGPGQIVEDPETSTKEGTKEVNFAGSFTKQP